MNSGTIRQQIMALLTQGPMDVIDLSRALALPEKEVLEHLPSIVRSVTGRGGRFIMEPAQCLQCGFRFKERRRLNPPGRCPRCKQSRLQGPAYSIIGNPRIK